MFKGFRDFVLRGNVVDLAVAVVIGAAFTAIVNALVTHIINPLIAAIVHKPDFSFLVLNVNSGIIKYGEFLNVLIAFVLIAATLYFLVVVPVNTLMAKFHPAPAARPKQSCAPSASAYTIGRRALPPIALISSVNSLPGACCTEQRHAPRGPWKLMLVEIKRACLFFGPRPTQQLQRQSRNAIASAFACILSGLTPGTLLSWSRLLMSPFCSR